MDAITIGTTVASLVTTFTKGAQTCNALLSKYKHAPQTLASIHTECTTIKLALSHVYWLANSNTELLSSQLDAQGPLAETFDVALTGCTVTFSLLDVELQKLCQQSKGKDTYSAKERLKFVWNEDLARSLLDDMRGLQGAVTLLLTALQTSSLAALNLTIAQQRPVIERVRQSTNSVCQSFSKTSQICNGSSDTYSIFSSSIGDEEFAFDSEVINTQVYRRVLNKASKAQVFQNANPRHESELFDEPLIDLSDEPKVPSVPSLDDSRAGSRWFGSFDGALPAELPGDSAFVGSDNDRAQDPTPLGDTPTKRSGNGPLSDRRSLKSRFAEPSAAEDSPFQAYNPLDFYFNGDNPGWESDCYEADNETGPTKRLARGERNQEAHFAVYQQEIMEVDGEQPPDLPKMQTTVQRYIISERPPPSPDARVSGSSDDTYTLVLENTAGEHAYETAPSSPLIRPTRPFPLYSNAPFSFESSGAVIAPLDRRISRHRSDASGYESVRDLHTSSLPRRTPSLQMETRAGTSSGAAISKSSQILGWIEPPDHFGAKLPDRYTDKRAGITGYTLDTIPWIRHDPGPLPPTINMQSVPQAEIERSGSETHNFILSALVWLVDPDSYTVNDPVVSNSISETRIVVLGATCGGKTSACRTYAAQNPELTEYTAYTVLFEDYKFRIPMIIDRSGVTQESIVNLRDTGWDLSAHDIERFSRHADVILLCYPVTEGCIDDVSEHWFPKIREQCPKVPVILVGMRTDKRETAKGDEDFPASSYEVGFAYARTNKAAAYVECSSTNLTSINRMFETAIRLALVSKLKVQQVQGPPLKHRLSRWWEDHKATQSTSSQEST